MSANWILHLALLRSFQLPIELRFVIIENYFPFLPKERSPQLLPVEIPLYFGYPAVITLFQCIPIGKNADDLIEDGDAAFVLSIRKEGPTLYAMIGRGIYKTSQANGIRFVQQEVLYYNEKIVMLRFNVEDVYLEINQQKIKSFYRQWVVHAINGVGCFHTHGWGFHDFLP